MKSKIKWIVGVVTFMCLLYSDLPPGTKAAVGVGIGLYLIMSERLARLEKTLSLSTHDVSEDLSIPSYKLRVHITPNWFRLYQKATGLSEEDTTKCIEEKRKELEDSESECIYGRTYTFTEYYDSLSGLTTRFQTVRYPSGKRETMPVDSFGERGYFFDSNDEFIMPSEVEDYDAAKKEQDKLAIEVGECFICNENEDENYLFDFPLDAIVEFLLALGTRFHNAENKLIIKWPDQIQAKFEELGIKYEYYIDYEPELFEINKRDKAFYKKWGQPQVALYGRKETSMSQENTFFDVKLKAFRPRENQRI